MSRDTFAVEGRRLLANGYLIVPIAPGKKSPALTAWQTARLGAADLSRYPGCGVGILTGQGAAPVIAIDIDVHDPDLVQRLVALAREHLGATVERVGNAPKILLLYRAREAGWKKAASPWFEDTLLGERMRVEVLAQGQQFVAHHIHPDTGRPYEWIDHLGGPSVVPALELPVVTQEQIEDFLCEVPRVMEEAGHQRVQGVTAPATVPTPPAVRSAPADEDFFGRVNHAAMEHLAAWVPALLPTAREYQGGFRVRQVDLGRPDLEEDLSILPIGIVDFGVHDMGDARQGKRTPIDLVLEWSHLTSDDLAVVTPFDAALWLCDQMQVSRESLGYGLRRQREREAERQGVITGLQALKERIAQAETSVALLTDLGAAARDLIRQSPATRAEITGAMRVRYKQITGQSILVSDLHAALRPRSGPSRETQIPLTEFGNTTRMLQEYGAGMMFVPELEAWFTWNGNNWQRAAQVEIEMRAKRTVAALGSKGEIEKEGHEPGEFHRFAMLSQQARMIANMVRLASSDPQVVVPADELDKVSYLLGAENGVIDLRSGELLPAQQDLRITRTAGCRYRRGARAPLWRQTVSEVFNGDEEMAEFFQRLIGYAAMGEPREDILVIPWGNGSNGKSTVLNTIRAALGGYAKAAEASSFISDGKGGGNAGGAREDLVRLKGARFVYVNEPDEGGELREGAVKAMTGGDAIVARGIHAKSSVEITPTWLVVMPTNHKPIVKGSDNGIWRRLMLIPFTRNFEHDTSVVKDEKRAEKLLEELPGVLWWIVEGALAYQRDGLRPPASVKAARDEYRTQMDLLAEWLEECCDVGPAFEEQAAHLWESWEEFARRRGIFNYVRSSVALGRRLDARFTSFKGAKGVRMRRGLRIKTDSDPI